MTNCRSRHRILLSSALLLLTAIPGLCATISVSSSVAPNPLLLPDQTLTYLGANNQSVIVGSGTFTLGAFESVGTTNAIPTASFTLTVTDSVDANALKFVGSIGATGGVDIFSFTGTGTEIINGITFATITDAGYAYGIQQSNTVNFDKGTPVISSIVSAVPEPTACLLCGLGFVTFASCLRKHRQDR